MEKSFICIDFEVDEKDSHMVIGSATKRTLDDITAAIDAMVGGPSNDPPVLYAGSIVEVLENIGRYTTEDYRSGFIALDAEDEELVELVYTQFDRYFRMYRYLHDGAILEEE